MATNNNLKDFLTDLANAFRVALQSPNPINPQKFSTKVAEVFNHAHAIGTSEGFERGKQEGFEEGKQEGIIEGKQAEYDAFWDLYQENGNRTHYNFAFAGYGWNDVTFKPKYDIKPTYASNMFANLSEKNYITNLVELLNSCGVIFDTSQCTTFSNFLLYASPKILPEIDTRNCTNLNSFSSNSSVQKIEKIILRNDGSQTVKTMFTYNHSGLKDIVFEGVVGQDFNMNTCPKLSKASIENIVSVLSVSATGKTLSISKTAKEREFTDEEWQTLIATKSNWTISLI